MSVRRRRRRALYLALLDPATLANKSSAWTSRTNKRAHPRGKQCSTLTHVRKSSADSVDSERGELAGWIRHPTDRPIGHFKINTSPAFASPTSARLRPSSDSHAAENMPTLSRSLHSIDIHLDNVDPLRIFAFQSTIELLHITGHPTEPLSLFTSSLSSSPRARQQRNTEAGGPKGSERRDFAPVPEYGSLRNTESSFSEPIPADNRISSSSAHRQSGDSDREKRFASRLFKFARHP